MLDFRPMAYEWGRFTWWLAQGQNAVAIQAVAAIGVVFITLWYALLTHRIMKATGKQASAALQPVLSLRQLDDTSGDPFYTLLIENCSERPIVFLDVKTACYPGGHGPIVHRARQFDDQILTPGNNAQLHLDFSKELELIRVDKFMCGFVANLVVSDLSRQVAIQYEYIWVLERFSCTTGLPWRVRLRYKIRPWVARYYRLKTLVFERYKRPR